MTSIETRDLLRDAPLKLIAARIRRARRQADMTLDGLAGVADTSRQHLINLEKGKHRPRPEMLLRIAEATGKTPDWFLVEDEDPNPFPEDKAA